MAGKNGNLHAAKKAKNDEFYTQLTDIEKELQHYNDFFNGKAVYCNCDHQTESNFPRYFLEHFEELGLERLTATCYMSGGLGWKGEKIKGGEYTVEQLDGDGDFRSDECVGLLKQADVVVTNPPFSLFREYVKQLMEYNKKFLIIGNQNAITYKEIFPYIKNNQLWLGTTNNNGMYYLVPKDYEYSASYKFQKVINGQQVCRVPSVCWFTNIENPRRNTPLDLYRKYNEKDFPKYDNYDAIEVSKVTEIPEDYNGVMGVPITFLYKYCPDQFTLLSLLGPYVNGKAIYKRLLIRRK